MAGFHDLPTEAFVLILDWLKIIDLQSLILSQRTNRQFRSIVQDALSSRENRGWERRSQWAGSPRIHPLWQSKFRGLFHSADALTTKDRQRLVFLTLDGDHTLPFRQLSWAQDEMKRSSYLRPEASWRAMSVTIGCAPITHLDLVKTYSTSDGTRDTVDYCQVDIPSSGLTMGMFYDLLLSEGVTYGCDTGCWELLLGKRLRSYDALVEYECFIADDEELVESGEPSRQAAILSVSGGSGCDVNLEREAWIPHPIGKNPLTLFPWQGPKPYFVF
ncbi:hypothetical protein SLS62_006219 [Diatrype stigma]|uniref:F-box domain-containing protein n=1 Tax=Diatrype stigma TaxID=117547 RepID=A0AAN9UQB2_9PEZI